MPGGRLLAVLPHWVPQTRVGDETTALIAPKRLRPERNRVLLDYRQSARQERGRITQDAKRREAVKD